MRKSEHEKERVKVAQLLFSGLGGHGSVVFSLLNASQHDRYWQSSLAFLGVEPMARGYAEQCAASHIPYIYLPGIPGRPWKSWSALSAWLCETEPNVVITHGLEWLLPCWWYARRRGVPLVLVEHHPNALKRRYVWALSAIGGYLADRVVVLTPVYREELRQKLGWLFRGRKVRVVPNGIDVQHFAPRSHRRLDSGKPIRMGMAARFAAGRRQDLLIDMLGLLRSQHPEVDWRLSLAGDGVTAEAVRARVREKGLEAFVEFPGHLAERGMMGWFQAMDIYLHASEGETLSTSLLQAMATALPVVASDISGIRAILKQADGGFGLLVDQTPQAFSAAVRDLVAAPENAAHLGQQARQKTIQTYSQDAMFAGYYEVVAELVSR